MGQLPQLILAALVLLMDDAGWTWGLVAPWALILLLPLPHLITLSGRNLIGGGSLKLGLLVGSIGRFSGPLTYALLVLACGWCTWLRARTGAEIRMDGWPELELLYAFAPYVLFELLSIDAQSRSACPPGPSRHRWRSFQVRMMATALVPAGLYYASTLLVGSWPWLRAHVEQVELVSALFLTLLLALLLVQLPTLLTVSWRTRPLEDPVLVTRFREIGEKAGFQARRVRVWETGNLVANAAIVGLLPSRREVLLSDSLIAQLDPDEVSAVYAHELGHSRCNHVPTFLAWAVAFLLCGQLVGRALGPFLPGGELLILALFLGGWFLVFGWLSRRFELQADLFSMNVIGGAAPLLRALEKLGGNLRDVGSWRHFGPRQREEFLSRAAVDRYWAWRFERRLLRLSMMGFGLCAAAIFIQVFLMLRALPEDRAWAALAMGDYDTAVMRAGDLSRPDERLKALVERAAQAHEEGPEALLERALTALRSGDGGAVRDWSELAALRGSRSAKQVVRVLDLVADGDNQQALEELWLAPVDWQRAMAGSLASTLAEEDGV